VNIVSHATPCSYFRVESVEFPVSARASAIAPALSMLLNPRLLNQTRESQAQITQVNVIDYFRVVRQLFALRASANTTAASLFMLFRDRLQNRVR
jgi:hypothetical protein